MQPGTQLAVVIVKAVDPVSVVCPESILVNALTTLGVPLHPDAGSDYAELREAIDGNVRRTLRWTLLSKSRDGKYKTAELIEWWRDPEWLKANPTHELAIIKVASENLLRLAARIRGTPHFNLLRKGHRLALIPSQLPEEKQQAARERLEAA